MPGSFLLIGKPGSGKSTAACSHEHPTLMIDVDNKAHRMFNISHLIKSGDVTILNLKNRLVSDRLRDRAANPDKGPKKEPQGYYEIVDILNDIYDGLPQYEQYKTIVLDSATRVAEHLKRLLIYHRSQGKMGKSQSDKLGGDMNWPSWGSYLSNMEELFNLASDFPKNFICCAHLYEDVEKDELTKTSIVKGYKPLIDGQMKDKLSGYFDEVYYLELEVKKGAEPKYKMRTYGAKHDARSSMELPEFVSGNLRDIVKEHTSSKHQ